MPVPVVAAAIVRDGRVLAARRVGPEAGWEFPGGKVEPGETPAAALERECREELGVRIRPVALVASVTAGRIELSLWHAELLAGTPDTLQDHDMLRWLAAGELTGMAWLPIDRELLAAVRALLG